MAIKQGAFSDINYPNLDKPVKRLFFNALQCPSITYKDIDN